MVIFDLHILLKLSKQFNFYMKPFIYLLKNLTEKRNSAPTPGKPGLVLSVLCTESYNFQFTETTV